MKISDYLKTLDEIYVEWEKDSYIDPTKITSESINRNKLHCKYWRYKSGATAVLRTKEAEYEQLVLLKREYYSGTLDRETIEKKHWKPFQKTILKTDIPLYLNADQELINLKLSIQAVQDIKELVESILKDIHTRQWDIRNHIEALKFENGVG